MERQMKQKSLWTIDVRVPGEADEAIIELFSRFFGLPASSYSDVETETSAVTVYFEERPQVSAAKRTELAAGFKRIRECGLDVGQPRLRVKRLPPQDWAESWK